MIKVTVRYNDHLVDIHFPCSETTLRSALMEIHAADDNPPELFVTDVIFPEELDHSDSPTPQLHQSIPV